MGVVGKNPNMARGRRSQANLKRGGSTGRPKKSVEEKALDKEAQRVARSLLTDPNYVAGLAERLNSGRCQPGVEVAVWHYAYGKPADPDANKPPVAVRIQHEFMGTAPEGKA